MIEYYETDEGCSTRQPVQQVLSVFQHLTLWHAIFQRLRQ